MSTVLRTIADGLICKAEERPRRSDSARLLRDAAASLLDADEAIEREDTIDGVSVRLERKLA